MIGETARGAITNSRSTPSANSSATPGKGVTPEADALKAPQSFWPARVTAETITPEQIRAFYTEGTWPEKMVYCDVLKVIGDLAISRGEDISHAEVARAELRAALDSAAATINSLNTQLAERIREMNFLQRQVEVGCALNDIKYEQWSHFCDAIPQHITLWVDRCPHCGMPRE